MTNQPHNTPLPEQSKPFLQASDFKPVTLADGTPVKLKVSKLKKSRLGRRYNGRHRD